MSDTSADNTPSFFSAESWAKRFAAMRRRGLGNKVALLLAVAAMISCMATYAAFTETPPFGDNPQVVIWLLYLDIVLLLMLGTMVARRVIFLWMRRKQGIAGAKIHVRLAFAFSLVATIPAVIMVIFSALFFNFGIQSWFNERVSTAVNESMAVAQAYLKEHQQVIRADVLAMANDLNREAPFLIGNQKMFDRVVRNQSLIRNLSEAMVFTSSGDILARSGFTFALEFEPIPDHLLDQAREGDVVLVSGNSDDRIRALVKLSNFVDTFLFVGRMVDERVLSHLSQTEEAVREYGVLEDQRFGYQVSMTLIFVVVAILMLLASIWFGLLLSKKIVTPIGNLISAAERVRAGDLTAKVSETNTQDEFETLARAFNRMTEQLEQQRNELMSASEQIDQRRKFTEAVLAGVSSGVMSVDQDGKITMVNSTAAELLEKNPDDLLNASLASVIPGIETIFQAAHERPNHIAQGEIKLANSEGVQRILLGRIATGYLGEDHKGAILTFDDISELQSAQRKAAWADVARRIAHEIKNPLTPIQLSAERLKRRYLKQITEGEDIFVECTDTIIRQVSDIGRMVNEFSSFARMPEPVLKPENITSLVKESISLQKQARDQIEIECDYSTSDILVSCDAQQVRQALTNILQNAVDAVEAKFAQNEGNAKERKIQVLVEMRDENVYVNVSDNGIGLPTENRDRLAEPYVTLRDKGTGLGLAIVKKIMEDHGGKLILGRGVENNNAVDLGGATITLVFQALVEQAGVE